MRGLCDKSLASSQALPPGRVPHVRTSVHGLNKTFFQCFHRRSTPTCRKEKGGASPIFFNLYAKVREHGAPVQGEAWWQAGKTVDEVTATPKQS